jgi:hypothetical protein
MSDNVPTGSGEVSPSVSVLSARLHVSSDEEDKEEDEESGHDDDEEDVDDINYVALPKDVVRVNRRRRRRTKSLVMMMTKKTWTIFRKRREHNLRPQSLLQ